MVLIYVRFVYIWGASLQSITWHRIEILYFARQEGMIGSVLGNRGQWAGLTSQINLYDLTNVAKRMITFGYYVIIRSSCECRDSLCQISTPCSFWAIVSMRFTKLMIIVQKRNRWETLPPNSYQVEAWSRWPLHGCRHRAYDTFCFDHRDERHFFFSRKGQIKLSRLLS